MVSEVKSFYYYGQAENSETALTGKEAGLGPEGRRVDPLGWHKSQNQQWSRTGGRISLWLFIMYFTWEP